jgi:hypothetical protein
MNAVSEAISKGIPTIQYEITLGFAHRNGVDCFALPKKGFAMTLSTEGEAVLRFASLTAALRIPHATHPQPLSF